MTKAKWSVRKAEPGDINLIISSWANVCRRMTNFRYMRNEVFKSAHARLTELIPTMNVYVAYDPQQPDVIYGWMATEGPVLHMVWVKMIFRRFGVGTALFEKMLSQYKQVIYTNHTKSLTEFGLTKKWRLSEYNPFLIYDRMKGVMNNVSATETSSEKTDGYRASNRSAH